MQGRNIPRRVLGQLWWERRVSNSALERLMMVDSGTQSQHRRPAATSLSAGTVSLLCYKKGLKSSCSSKRHNPSICADFSRCLSLAKNCSRQDESNKGLIASLVFADEDLWATVISNHRFLPLMRNPSTIRRDSFRPKMLDFTFFHVTMDMNYCRHLRLR